MPRSPRQRAPRPSIWVLLESQWSSWPRRRRSRIPMSCPRARRCHSRREGQRRRRQASPSGMHDLAPVHHALNASTERRFCSRLLPVIARCTQREEPRAHRWAAPEWWSWPVRRRTSTHAPSSSSPAAACRREARHCHHRRTRRRREWQRACCNREERSHDDYCSVSSPRAQHRTSRHVTRYCDGCRCGCSGLSYTVAYAPKRRWEGPRRFGRVGAWAGVRPPTLHGCT